MSNAIPIRNGGDQGIPLQFHRDSFAHSQGMGGISWGGASVGSWLRDEVLMATKENKEVANNFGSLLSGSAISDAMEHAPAESGGPSAHDTGLDAMGMSPEQPAYFPSIEANFCRDYSCCGRILPTLHDLLRHYEEQHISPSPPDEPPVMRRMQNIETVSTNDVFLPFDQSRHQQGLPGQQQQHVATNIGRGAGGNRNDGSHGFGRNNLGGNANNNNSLAAGDGTNNGDLNLNGSGMDFDDFSRLGGRGSQQQHMAFAPPSFQPLNQGMGNFGAYSGSQSGMNRSKQGAGALGQGDGGLGDASSVGFGADGSSGNAAVTSRLALGDDEEPTIDDPARQLYMLERSENKPFKCPVIGCEKTYKNQNGLKYHRQHGHQNQTLHLNDDGTYSIIDPLSNTPYPDGMGMEKDKPYRCEICGKRYKNLNGLKYHRAHSTH